MEPRYLRLRSSRDAPALLEALANEEPHPDVVRIAQNLKTPRDIHAYVKRRVVYTREDPEFFTRAHTTLLRGFGDCDDSALAVCQLAKAKGIPNKLVYFTRRDEPVHVAPILYDRGTWRYAETTLPSAEYGEHPLDVAQREGHMVKDLEETGASNIETETAGIDGLAPVPPNLVNELGANFPQAMIDAARTVGRGITPLDIARIGMLESGWHPHAVNSLGYVGINQFSRANLWAMGIDPDSYATWTAEQQLPVAAKFWAHMASAYGHGATSLDGVDLYWLNFLPGTFVPGKSLDYVIAGPSDFHGWLAHNPALVENGVITKGSLARALLRSSDNSSGATKTRWQAIFSLTPSSGVFTKYLEGVGIALLLLGASAGLLSLLKS